MPRTSTGDYAARYTRLPDPAAGVRAYQVTVDCTVVGTVTNRRGGWWRATTADGVTVGSFHYTRAEATRSLRAGVPLYTAR